MDENIKIRAGAGLQAVLQSTVNFAQAFTELAKNSLQNGATSCNIDIIEFLQPDLIVSISDGSAKILLNENTGLKHEVC